MRASGRRLARRAFEFSATNLAGGRFVALEGANVEVSRQTRRLNWIAANQSEEASRVGFKRDLKLASKETRCSQEYQKEEEDEEGCKHKIKLFEGRSRRKCPISSVSRVSRRRRRRRRVHVSSLLFCASD